MKSKSKKLSNYTCIRTQNDLVDNNRNTARELIVIPNIVLENCPQYNNIIAPNASNQASLHRPSDWGNSQKFNVANESLNLIWQILAFWLQLHIELNLLFLNCSFLCAAFCAGLFSTIVQNCLRQSLNNTNWPWHSMRTREQSDTLFLRQFAYDFILQRQHALLGHSSLTIQKFFLSKISTRK